eukprot:GHRR01012773.1.p1 GENE.GHRR01012773.1~~GHRR01012773.1.p1  ORF type:complete len:1051 (+),score=372.66 GHRR01012773.1:153-3305(+)
MGRRTGFAVGQVGTALLLLTVSALLLTPLDAGKPRDEKRGRWRRPPPPPGTAGTKLFHNEDDTLSWDNDELTRIQSLHLQDFSSVEDYLKSPNLAHYLALHPVEALHMTVAINLVFIGFQGDGSNKLDVNSDELMSWFRHVDHVLPHTRIALSELSCSTDAGHCAGTANASLPPSPLPSFVHLNMSCNVVAIQKGEVLAIFERAIAAFSRPMDPDHETGDQQVDALKLEPFIDSFITALGLDRGYTVLVVNPKWSASLPSYAYRLGFSDYELQLLNQQASMPELQPHQAAAKWGREPSPPMYASRHTHTGQGFYTGKKFQVTDLQSVSSSWAKAAAQYLSELEDFQRRVIKLLGPKTKGTAALMRAATLLQGHAELSQLLLATLKLAPEHLHNPRFRATHPLEDCPTPLWVSKTRWLLLDLTARRTDWGPALGGDGVVTHNTLPDVSYAFAETEEKRADKRLSKEDNESELELKNKLSIMRNQRLAQVANQQQHAKQLHVGQHLVHGLAPGEAPADQLLDPDGNPVGAGGSSSQEAQEEVDRHHQEALLQAELNVYEEFATVHCAGRINPPIVCVEAQEAVLDLKHTLEVMTKGSGNKMLLNPDHHWDIFGVEMDDEQTSATYSAAKDVFFSELSNVLSRGLRHVVAPPSATWHHRGYLHDTASPFAHKVHFTIYTIQDTSRVLGPWRLRGVHFDLEAFKQQLSRLAMPHQAFSFNQVTLNMLDDPVLAGAFAVSLRTSFLQVPHAVSDPVENEALYLDSRELALRLRQRFDMVNTRRVGSLDPHALLEVPVFVFELDRDVPVLIDEHYNARALEDLVVIVQNAANQDEHPTGMMCDGILLQRPLSPLKHALSAVVQHLGGVLPPHLGYNPGRKVVQHDWLWSVGAHPLSWTSWGGHYSQMHIDALHRSYILDAIDSSVDLVNSGIALLQSVAPVPETHQRISSMKSELQQLLQQFAQVVNVWRAMVAHGAVLEYHAAAEIITTSETLARTFVQHCRKVLADLHPHHCAARVGGLPRLLIIAIYGTSTTAGLAVASVLVLPLFKRKAKSI